MWGWQLIQWGIAFLGSTHGWVSNRWHEASGLVSTLGPQLLSADWRIQALAVLLYAAGGVLFALQPAPQGLSLTERVAHRVALGVFWLPFLGLIGSFAVYMLGFLITTYAVTVGGLILVYEAPIRFVLGLFGAK